MKNQSGLSNSDPGETGASPGSFVMERLVPLGELDRSFDIAYRQRQGDSAIFEAAWEMVVTFQREHGLDPDELRLQRSVESIQRP